MLKNHWLNKTFYKESIVKNMLILGKNKFSLKKIISYGFLITAVILIIGHTLLSNNHNNHKKELLSLNSITHSLPELIENLLSQNLGKNRLKNVLQPTNQYICKEIQTDFLKLKALSYVTANNKTQTTLILTLLIKELETHGSALKLRGPPQI
jgi:uncharacterized membrane protein YvbJ